MQTTIDLLPRYRGMLMQLLDRHVPSAEVWAFGSRVNGDGHAGSDLDLVLRDPLDLQQASIGYAALLDGLTDSMLPVLVDVHDWAALPPKFRQEIERRYAVLKQATAPG